MFSRLLVRLLCLALAAGGAMLRGEEVNGWPLVVQQVKADGTVESADYLPPFGFHKVQADGAIVEGVRPFWLHARDRSHKANYFLYPFFAWRTQENYRSFSFFQLINFHHAVDNPSEPADRGFDVWPFYFSRDTGNPEDSYQALFPLGGTIKHRFGFDRIRFVLFPLYADTEKRAAHTVHAPWPFLRFIHGGGQEGFEFWPLFGHRGKPGDFDTRFWLWPLGYRDARHLSEPVPDIKVGVLPFYTRDTGPGLISETYLWPFFGYTHRTEPKRYDEQRYFWPFLVQGRGDDRVINRWAPFYTHSVVKGYDKTWAPWPLFRHAVWTDDGLVQDRKQVLYFLYWSLTQCSPTNPNLAPAHKTHVWPLLSSWDNGAGRKQVQLFSPFEVFFPTNEPVRQLYTPLVAIYRYDRRAPGEVRQSFLFNLVSWKKSPAEREFHLGPLVGKRTTPAGSRFALGMGLLSWTKPAGTDRWKFSLFDFSRESPSKAPVTQTP